MPEKQLSPVLAADHRAHVASQQHKRYARTKSEVAFLQWVTIWVLLVALATGAMLYVLLNLREKPVADDHARRLLDLHRRLTAETYYANDRNDALLRRHVTADRIKSFMK